MSMKASIYANQLRQEICVRNRLYARNRSHAESYGENPVIVYAPEGGHHGNFFHAAYRQITAHPEWMRRFNKVHAQAARSLPKAERRWRELDSSTSSDALLMNIFCTPGVAESAALRGALGVDQEAVPQFGWKARVPLAMGRFDRTEVDMRLGSLLVEAKLTETNFQVCKASMVEPYRDFDTVFNRELLPRIELPPKRRKQANEFPEQYSQEFESFLAGPQDYFANRYLLNQYGMPPRKLSSAHEASQYENQVGEAGYASYQLIRNVLAAYSENTSLCVMYDGRRPDLRERWFEIMCAVRCADLRTRLKAITWQELVVFLPNELKIFLNLKYGIIAPE